MISRVADHCFWLGRYIERAESTARVLPVTLHQALDRELTPRQCWLPVIIVSGEEARFTEKLGYEAAEDGEVVQEYMTWNDENMTSIRRSIQAVRENARSIREVLSLEVWQTVNELHLFIQGADARAQYDRDRDGFYKHIRDHIQMVLGFLRGTMLHETPLDFIWLGMLLERVGQTSRILDVHYHTLSTRPSFFEMTADAIAAASTHQVVDTAVWLSLLRACSGLEPFMQRFQGRVSGKAVARFLIQEPRFPRALRYCVHSAYVRLTQIRPPSDHQLPGGHTLERLRALDEWLTKQQIDALDNSEVHDVLTHCVDEVAAICEGLGRELFGYAPVDPPPPSSVAVQSIVDGKMTQTMGGMTQTSATKPNE